MRFALAFVPTLRAVSPIVLLCGYLVHQSQVWVHDYDWSLGQVDDWLMADTPSTAPTTPTPEPKAKGKSKGAKRVVTIQGGYTAA